MGQEKTIPSHGLKPLILRIEGISGKISPCQPNMIKSSITHTGNIGEDSLMIHLPTKMDVSQPPRLKLFFSLGSELNTIRLPAEVVWMDNHSNKNPENYQYGVKSIDISPEDETMLKTC